MLNPNSAKSQKNPIRTVAESAAHALGFRDHFVPGFEEPKRIPVPAVGSGTIDLSTWLSLKAAPSDIWHLNMLLPGESVDIDPRPIIEQHSRVVQAGASLIIAHPKPAPDFVGQPVFYHDAGLVRTIDPASFATVADGADASISNLPIHDATFGWPAAPSQAFRATITRAQHRAVGGPELYESFMIAILRGLGELADSLLIAAILAATPAKFGFGLAAARHAKIADLRALVGTSGLGAEIAGDGSFRADGVFAELTAATDQTVIGMFNRAAVAIRPELSVHIRRLNVDGDTELSVFCNAQAVVPNAAGDFWIA